MRKMRNAIGAGALLLAGLLGAGTTTARADASPFGYSYGAEPVPQGSWEIYQWVTSRHGREGKPDLALNLSTEVEYGFTDRLAGSLYVDTGVFSDEDFVFRGLKSAWKYNVLSPFKDPIGLSFYLEPIWGYSSSTSGAREDKWALEAKVLMQKNLLEDHLVLVSNLVAEWESEREPGEDWADATVLKWTWGASYRLAGNWFLGVEALYETEFEGFGLSEQAKQQLAIGPNVHWAKGSAWATLTWLPQVWGTPESEGNRNLRGYDEHQIRLIVGLTF